MNQRDAQPANSKLILEELYPYAAGKANYLINISERWNYLYFEMPKVACSTIKRTLQTLEVDGATGRLPKDVHAKQQSPLKSPTDNGVDVTPYLLTREKFSFMFVRNPYSRILSCYLDKIVTNNLERQRLLPTLGFKPDHDVSFDEFLRAVAEQRRDEMDIHWAPQAFLSQTPEIDYTFIGRFEHFEREFRLVLTRLLGDAMPTDAIKTVIPHKTSASKCFGEYLTRPVQQQLSAIYEDDFRKFGYSFDPHFNAL